MYILHKFNLNKASDPNFIFLSSSDIRNRWECPLLNSCLSILVGFNLGYVIATSGATPINYLMNISNT